MKSMLVTLLVLLSGFAQNALANELKQVGSAKAGAVASFEVNQNISKVVISCADGEVTIKQIKLVKGKDETPFNQQASLKKGARQQFTVGNAVSCDKLQVTTEGQGSYNVLVRP